MYRLSNTFPTVYFFQEEDSCEGFQKISKLGKINFQGRKIKFPALENFLSSVGKFPFLRRKRKLLRGGSLESLFGGELDRLGVRGFWRRGIGEERL